MKETEQNGIKTEERGGFGILSEEQLQSIKDVLKPFVPRVIINERGRRRMMRRLKELALTRAEKAHDNGRPMGINLYGDRLSGTGLSMSVSALIGEFEAAGIPYSFHQVNEKEGRVADGDEEQTDYAVNIFHLQPPVWAYFALHIDRESVDNHYNIAHWAWETPQLPEEWIPAADYFDEIWVPSAFVARAVLRSCPGSLVRVMPHGICAGESGKKDTGEVKQPEGRTITRLRYGISSDAFTVILLYDGRSSTERKNPLDGIRAYQKAFPSDREGACLIVKGKHLERGDRRRIERITGERKDIRFVDGELSYAETQALIGASDVLLSLHRAEGFGLPVAEAMRAGVIPVATDYSATKEIMDENCGMPVRYRMIRTGKSYGVYRRGTIWASPDVEDAAEKLKKLKEDPELRKQLSEAAKKRVWRQLDAKRIGERICERLSRICTEEEDA